MPFINGDGQVVYYSRSEKRAHFKAVAAGEKINENSEHSPEAQKAYAKGRLSGERSARRRRRRRY